MLLFERVRRIAREMAGSETKLAEKISLSQKSFNWYMKESSEKNLWQHLPKILEIYPEISRDWLYFDEGDMLAGATKPMRPVAVPPSERETALERENALLRERLVDKEELIASQKETIAMQKQMLRQVCAPLGESAGAPGFAARQSATDTPARGARTSTDKSGIGRQP